MTTKITRSGSDIRQSANLSAQWSAMRPPVVADTLYNYDFGCPLPPGTLTGGSIIETDYLSTPYALQLASGNILQIRTSGVGGKNFFIGSWLKLSSVLAGSESFALQMGYRGPIDLDNPLTSDINEYTAGIGLAVDGAGTNVNVVIFSGGLWPVVFTSLATMIDDWFYLSLTWSPAGYLSWQYGPFSYTYLPAELVPTLTASGLTKLAWVSSSLDSSGGTWLVDRFTVGVF